MAEFFDTITVAEGELLEKTLGVDWTECVGPKGTTPKVMRGFVWLYRRRSNPDLKLEDVDFAISRFAEELGYPEDDDTVPLPDTSGDSSTPSTSP